jgi:hypothetical protein
MGTHGAWRVEIGVRVDELRHRLTVATAAKRRHWPRGASEGTRHAAAKAVEDSLATAEAATEKTSRVPSLRDWRSGAPITTAWESIHEAEMNVMRLEAPATIWTHLSKLLAWIQQAMDSGYLRARHETELKAQIEAPTKNAYSWAPLKVDRAAVEQAFRDVVIANRERYASVRAFRNTLVLVTAMLAGLIVVLAIWHAVNTDFITLCSAAEGGNDKRCLHASTSERLDVALVALVGALGGFMALAFRLSDSDVTPSRYDPRVWQTLLKPVAGAATAVAGVLFIQANFLTGVVNLHTEAPLLSYALLFGFSQQLFTQFIDKRADTLISSE